MAPLTMDEQMAQLEYARQNPAEFADFNIPWSVNISYSLSFYNRFNRDYSGFETEINSNASIGGDFNLTPRWKMGVNSYYDFKTSKIQMLTMYISREMHCWQMSINITPVGLYRSFNITISPKSGILRDLRINRTRSFYGG
jgi:LPS-assembly protein